MNSKQLREVGVPASCMNLAIDAVAEAAKTGAFADRKPAELFAEVVSSPGAYIGHRLFGKLARALIEHEDEEIPESVRDVRYKQWGEEIDEASKQQMRDACKLPVSVAGALMPDAHIGYG